MTVVGKIYLYKKSFPFYQSVGIARLNKYFKTKSD